MKLQILALVLLSSLLSAQPAGDFVPNPPGMDNNIKLYSGYLQTYSPQRELHYMFVESEGSPFSDPLMLWLNGGPGCSSMEGLFHEIGPYIVGNKYTKGQGLLRNNYAWTKKANVLFLQSPAGVGYSTNKQGSSFPYDDKITAQDNFAALQSFLTKFPSFKNRTFYIAGESYAGKYIPDLAALILDRRSSFGMNLEGILVGNGVMSFENDELHKSSVQYLYDHDFISPHLMSIYKESCLKDYESPRCRFFNFEFNEVRRYLNHYNVYEVCTSKTSEGSVLNQFVDPHRNETQPNTVTECPSDEGMIAYMNANKQQFHSKNPDDWKPCSSIHYNIDPAGSIARYKRIFLASNLVRVWLYSGDWDDVVPYTDTLKNLEKMGLRKVGPYKGWFIGQNHAGFYQVWEQLTLITVKGAGHMVPTDKRESAFKLVSSFIDKRPLGDTIPEESM